MTKIVALGVATMIAVTGCGSSDPGPRAKPREPYLGCSVQVAAYDKAVKDAAELSPYDSAVDDALKHAYNLQDVAFDCMEAAGLSKAESRRFRSVH